jgi:threonine/homoserine/homoserine lactone efflux protein
MSARIGIRDGLRTGIFLSVGIGIGGMVWAAAALFGLNLLFAAAPALLLGFKIIGGAYLVWMGWHMWREAAVPLEVTDVKQPSLTPLNALRLGLITQLANPKPAVLFSAIFLGTVPPTAPAWVYGVILLIVFANETIWNSAVARVFSFDRTKRAYTGLKSTIDRAFGAALAVLGVKIAAT